MCGRINKSYFSGSCFCSMKSKSAEIEKCIKNCFTVNKPFNKEAVIALIEIESGLMSLFKINNVINRTVADKFVLNFTEIYFILYRKPFQSSEIILILCEYIFCTEIFH